MGEHSGAKRLQNLKAKQRQKGAGGEPNSVPLIQGVMVPEPVGQPQQFQGFSQPFQATPQNVGTPNMLPSASVAPHSQVVPPQPPKGPLPAEHQAAKQRLEDLSMKLEILYDKLREGKVCKNCRSVIKSKFTQ
ncbi:hypothetical protein Avbf_12487 [Armadillidium vulgare]|nr:hypothetical protein Avbf_12487 [Armadillidium vulgare]